MTLSAIGYHLENAKPTVRNKSHQSLISFRFIPPFVMHNQNDHFCIVKLRFNGHTSRKHLRTKVTPDLHLTYIKNGGNLGLVFNDKKWKFLHKIICCGILLESPRGGDSNR